MSLTHPNGLQREVTLADKFHISPFPLWLSGDFHDSDNWAIYVRTQYADVRHGELPVDEFYDRLAKVTPRKPRFGEDVTPTASETVSAKLEPELASDIANPPRPDTTTFSAAPLVLIKQHRRNVSVIVIIALFLFILVAAIIPNLNVPRPTTTPATNVSIKPSDTFLVTLATTATQTVDNVATADNSTRNAQSTVDMLATQNLLNQTATARIIEAYRTQQAATATANFFAGLTATASLWTSTPTPTAT